MRIPCLLALAIVLAAGSLPRAGAVALPQASGYAAPRGMSAEDEDTLRPRNIAAVSRARRSAVLAGSLVTGYLSQRGLPPVAGAMFVTDSGLVFEAANGAFTSTFPLVGPLRKTGGKSWRASAVSVAYTHRVQGRTIYMIRVDNGLFETDAPGPLLDLAAHPAWLDSLGSREWAVETPLVNPNSRVAVNGLIRTLVKSRYADTLFALFGRPKQAVGVVGDRGRNAGRLGEYVASRDSLALDPSRMSTQAQLRHALAHELAHRWQARAPGQMAVLWAGTPPIRDPKRYGYGSVSEHQAEAVAFAIHYLQLTAAAKPTSDQTELLEHYELLVPGTSMMTRYLALQPIYAKHPLRKLLTTGQN
ncbi:MAG: hypothetical protein ACREL3_13930 [Gemmatimonadales bacterium]